ncbi:MAG: type IV pilin protein [Lysobacteraceae bacterium]|jgi:type IV pilus assembly protein PilE
MFKRSKMGGFSLIELMVVVAIVAIITAIAVPSYQEQVRKSNRGLAKSDLLELTQCAERFHTTNSTYTGFDAADACDVNDKDGDWYDFAVANVTRTTFTLSATAQGGQVDDKCGNLGINQANVRTHSAGTAADRCWE